jgi:hypothetical protein
MKRALQIHALSIGTVLLLTTTAHAGPPKDPPTKCAPDAVLVGATCVDKYEASVWLVPPTNGAGKSNKGLIKKIKKGKAVLADLTAGSATQLGCTFAPFSHAAYPINFPANGNWTADPAQPLPPSPGVYAVSIPGVLPSTCTTWFQAEQACRLSGKRLLTNQDWQAAAQGTPDPGTDNLTTDCAVSSPNPVNTGSRSNCVSSWGASDMVGNVLEWVADWGDQADGCSNWGGTFGSDMTCFGESAGSRFPGALVRGGYWSGGTGAGVFAADGSYAPSLSPFVIGLRCGR